MPVEPGGRESAATSGTEGALFAPVPIWERGRKQRRGGRPASDPAMDAGEATPAGLGEPADPAYETQPADVGVETPDRQRRDPPVGGIALGVVALVVIAAVGWFAGRPHDRGMPELVPGSPAASPVAYVASPEASPSTPATPGADPAKRPPAAHKSTMPAKPPKESADVTSRVRPAPNATDAGANASATAAPTITPPSPGSPSTDPMTVNPAPTARPAPAEGPPTVGARPTQPAPAPDAGTTP